MIFIIQAPNIHVYTYKTYFILKKTIFRSLHIVLSVKTQFGQLGCHLLLVALDEGEI